jgi:heat shock protein HtpX
MTRAAESGRGPSHFPASGLKPTQRKLRNLVHTLLLLGAMLMLLGICASSVWGATGALWSILGGVAGLCLAPSLPPDWLLQLYRARPIPAGDLPGLTESLEMFAHRAGITPPRLFRVPSPFPAAFTLGGRGSACIALTEGLLAILTGREIAGVLAHELSHIRNHDLGLMMLAGAITTLTTLMGNFGLLLLILQLPLLLIGQAPFPWPLVLVLLLAPTATSLLQLALARRREFEADLNAAYLTGDPVGLASALGKLQWHERRSGLWLAFPTRQPPTPSLLRSHPRSEERIRRLLDLCSTRNTPAGMAQELASPEPSDLLYVPARRPTRRWPWLLLAGLAATLWAAPSGFVLAEQTGTDAVADALELQLRALAQSKSGKAASLRSIAAYYGAHGFAPIWTGTEEAIRQARIVSRVLEAAAGEGLDSAEYAVPLDGGGVIQDTGASARDCVVFSPRKNQAFPISVATI